MKSSSQSRLHALELRKPCPEMPRGAWESVHGGSRKWFPEQHPRSRQPGIEQRLLAPLPVTSTSARAGLKHQVRTGARPSMPQPGQDSRQRHQLNSDRHGQWTPRWVDKRVLVRNADYGRMDAGWFSRWASRRLSRYGSCFCRVGVHVLLQCPVGRLAPPDEPTSLSPELGVSKPMIRRFCRGLAGA